MYLSGTEHSGLQVQLRPQALDEKKYQQTPPLEAAAHCEIKRDGSRRAAAAGFVQIAKLGTAAP